MATIQNPDDTTTTAFEATPAGMSRVAVPPWSDADALQVISGQLAAHIAVHDILDGLRVQVGSFENLLVAGGSYAPVRELRVHPIILGMPDTPADIKPLSASIIERTPQVFDQDHRPRMLKEQWHGFSLRELSKSTVTLGVVAWFGHKNELRAFRTAFVRSFLAEPLSERGGRIIRVARYFDQPVRLNLVDAQEMPSEDLADHWVLQATVAATVSEIMAIAPPQKIKTQIAADIGVDVEP